MLCLVLNSEFFADSEKFVDEITERFPKIVSIMLNVNRKSTNVVLGDKYKLLFGKSVLEDELCRLKFKIAPEAFYQVNHDGAELLYGRAAELATNHAKNEGKPIIVDLYCGTGTIGLSMANKAQRILGIDIVEKSIECAKENAALNNIQNAEFCSTDAGYPENIKRCLCEHKIKLSDATVIIDPPRKGSTKELVDCLASLDVKKIVYVSCNPDTLARDCAWFVEANYEIGEVQPVDMFPRTGHVESVVCLSRK
jgi:23S rRNA (uracil1939-C5)-methyltransferase